MVAKIFENRQYTLSPGSFWKSEAVGMRIAVTICVLLIPGAVFACWEIQGTPYPVENTKISGVFTYQQKPIRAALLRLEDASGHAVANGKTDTQGAFEFTSLKPGIYRLRMLKPSNERLDINLVGPTGRHTGTTLRINFYADFCQEVRVVPGT